MMRLKRSPTHPISRAGRPTAELINTYNRVPPVKDLDPSLVSSMILFAIIKLIRVVDISAVIALPNATPAPLRPSRRPLPGKVVGAHALAKPPTSAFYASYLDSLAASGSAIGGSSRSLWQDYLNAAAEPTSGDIGSAGLRHTHAGQSKAPVQDANVVPDLFFREDFDLANPLIWESLSRTSTSDPATAVDADIIHLLSEHLDVLETRLVQEVSRRAPMFFSALTNLQNLTSQSTACLDQIALLQATLDELDSSCPRQGLAVAASQHTLQQFRQVSIGLGAVQSAVDSMDLARQLSRNHDWSGALEALSDLQHWCAKNGGSTYMTQHRNPPDVMRKSSTRVNRVNGNDSLILTEISEEDSDGLCASDAVSPSSSIPIRKAGPISVTLTSLSSIQDAFQDLQPLVEGMRIEIMTAISEKFLSILEMQVEASEQSASPADQAHALFSPIRPILQAFNQCGGSSSDVVALWRGVCLNVVRETMRRVSTGPHRHR